MTPDDVQRPDAPPDNDRIGATRARRAYTAPHLTDYGPLAKLTQSGAFTANGDAGQMMMA